MAVIQYFLPGATKGDLCEESGKIRQQVLRDRGIAEALRDLVQVPRDAVLTGVQHGPDGGGGLLITPVRFDGQVACCCYVADKQIWREVGNSWMGTTSSEPVTPGDLQRRRVFLGYQVGDNDVLWLVPIARSDDTSRISLPQDITFRDKLAVKTLRAQYSHLWDLAGQILDWTSGVESPATEEQWRIHAALTVLNCNYRLWRDECNLAAEVGSTVLDTQLVDAICVSVADVQFAVEVKKKDSSGSGQGLPRFDECTTGIGAGADTTLVGAS